MGICLLHLRHDVVCQLHGSQLLLHELIILLRALCLLKRHDDAHLDKTIQENQKYRKRRELRRDHAFLKFTLIQIDPLFARVFRTANLDIRDSFKISHDIPP